MQWWVIAKWILYILTCICIITGLYKVIKKKDFAIHSFVFAVLCFLITLFPSPPLPPRPKPTPTDTPTTLISEVQSVNNSNETVQIGGDNYGQIIIGSNGSEQTPTPTPISAPSTTPAPTPILAPKTTPAFTITSDVPNKNIIMPIDGEQSQQTSGSVFRSEWNKFCTNSELIWNNSYANAVTPTNDMVLGE